MSVTRLCLVRHGETAWNAEGRVQGQLDVPLSATGLAQARAVSSALARETFSAIYASDLARVRQTAEPAAARLGLEVRLEAALRERHYGIFQSLTYAEVKQKYPEDYARFDRRELYLELLQSLKDQLGAQGATLECVGFGATGYAADVLEECVLADLCPASRIG